MTPRAAVVGHPISHSLSPRIFAEFSQAAGRELSYEALDLLPEDLESELKKTAAGGWVGWNVTLPHKVAVLPLLDELDASAREAGAANVLRFAGERRIGYNTDAEGFLAPLKAGGFPLKGCRALVFGAGGAARAVCLALKREGASELRILNRSAERAAELASAFGASCAGLAGDEAPAWLGEADLVVNASSAGLDGRGSPLPSRGVFKRGALAYDLVYRPKLTPFMRSAREHGARTLGGLAMLTAQAAATWRIWFSEELSAEAVEKVRIRLEDVIA